MKTSQQREHWFKYHWRPAMGWMYMVVCIFDFIVFPALWSGHLGYLGQAITQWEPITLRNGGFFHIAMCTVLGIYAWKRSDEKIMREAVEGVEIK